MPPLLAAALVVLLEALAFGVTLPVLAHYNEQFGGTPALLGVLFALVSGPKVLTSLWFGRLADRFGRRPVLVLNTLGTLAGSVLWAVSLNLWWLAASRLVVGIFSAQAGVAQSIVADVTSSQRRAAAMGVLGAAFGVALGLGPPLGGVVARNFSPAAVGWVCVILQFLSLLVILLVLKETRTLPEAGNLRTDQATDDSASGADVTARRSAESPAKQANVSPTDPFAPPVALPQRSNQQTKATAVLNQPLVYPMLAVMVLLMGGQSAKISSYALATRDLYGFDSAQTGYAFALFGLVGIITQGALIRPAIRVWGERATALLGLSFLTTAMLLLAVRPPLPLFWTSAVIEGVGIALAMSCLSAMLTRLAPAAQQGELAGLNQGAMGLGRTLGFFAGGGLYGVGGVMLTYGMAGGMMLAALLLVWPLSRHEELFGEPPPVAGGAAR